MWFHCLICGFLNMAQNLILNIDLRFCSHVIPAKPRDHTWSHTKATPRSALFINGTAFPIRIHITIQVNLPIRIILESIINYTLQVPQNMLCRNQVNMSQICQELAQGVHNKANVWSCVRQVHQWSNHLMIHRRINHLRWRITQKLQVRCDRCGYFLIVQHSESLQNLHCINSLTKENPICTMPHLHA